MSFLKSLLNVFRRGADSSGAASHIADAPSPSAQAASARPGASAGRVSVPELRDFAPEWIVIGLGNPGAKYAATRHNIGYWPIDRLVDELGVRWSAVDGVRAQVAAIHLGDIPVLLVRSTTYMNESGEAVGPLAAALGAPANRVIVCHDELDIAKGQVRIKDKGGEGGHNGLRSISAELGTQGYVRVRMGIGRPPQGTPVIDFVLQPFEREDTDLDSGWMENTLRDSVDAVKLIVAKGTDIARNDIHTRKHA